MKIDTKKSKNYRAMGFTIWLMAVFSCIGNHQTSTVRQDGIDPPPSTIYTHSIVSNLNQPETFALIFRDQTLPTIWNVKGILKGIFSSTSMEEFAPFDHLNSDELIILMKWNHASIGEIESFINKSLSIIQSDHRSKTTFYKALSDESRPFIAAGFYVHRRTGLSQEDEEQIRTSRGQNSKDDWVYQEILEGQILAQPKILHISRYDSYENWKMSTISGSQNTSRSIFQALKRSERDGHGMASQLNHTIPLSGR